MSFIAVQSYLITEIYPITEIIYSIWRNSSHRNWAWKMVPYDENVPKN
jgi:hypothetical protein